MSNINQVVDVQIQVKNPSVTKVGFGTAAILYSRAKATTTRVFTFTDPTQILEETDLSEVTETSEVYLMAVELYNVVSGDGFKPSKFKIIVRDTTDDGGSPTETLTEALDDADNKDKDWWGILMPERGTASQTGNEEVGSWVKTQTKAFFTVSDDVNLKDTDWSQSGTDIADVFQNGGNGRTFVGFCTEADKYPDCTLLGRNLPYDPGSVNWKFTQYNTAIQDVLTATERLRMDGSGDTTLQSKNCNYFEKIAGKTILSSSAVMSNGEYVDVLRGMDWLTAEMAADLFALLIELPKIAMTNNGIALVDNRMRKSLDLAVQNDVLTEYTVSTPDESEVSDNDRANRQLTGITFTGNLAGAVNFIQIRGTVYI